MSLHSAPGAISQTPSVFLRRRPRRRLVCEDRFFIFLIFLFFFFFFLSAVLPLTALHKHPRDHVDIFPLLAFRDFNSSTAQLLRRSTTAGHAESALAWRDQTIVVGVRASIRLPKLHLMAPC